ncbi:TonB-dependent receptor [Caulobacter sp. Root487D2Y]|uniref:TonB-dependent siderophore receptor n=1 Tax=Caulobacter sp. Root487D2Y TaxID=1736547 RepID=UPI0006F1C829|nr:TonB-dependent siderophore receptor [Caulobacter sp. Root487D2Y]KQY35574.1 TonB-dependent receptor [Caulobacter sp. Root487D2Y]
MTTILRALLLAGASVAAVSWGGSALADDTASADADILENQVDGLVVTGARTRTSAVTGLDMSLRETPQSVTILDQARIRDFGLTSVHDLLAQVTGVNVEKVETDRTYYNSRGFDITNFQVDGIGLPLIWGIQFGDLDTVLFDRVEVVRGANSMMTGAGNPSATVNYVRKRPTDGFQAAGALQYGSWEDYRLEADVAGPLNAAGTVRGRLIYANEDKGSYLDHHHVNRNVYSALLAWDVTPRLTATAGYSLQDNRSRGVLWGALPLNYSDGTPVDYPSSASTSADWTYWNVKDQTAFTELDYKFDNGWKIKATATYKRFDEKAKLLYAYDSPDPVTGLGVKGMSGIYPSKYRNYILDAYASGPFQLFGRTHQLVVGGQTSKSTGLEWENFSGDAIVYPDVRLWGSRQVAEPTYPGEYLASDQTDRLSRFYAAAHFSVTDPFKIVAGFNALKLKSKGYSYGTDTPRDEEKVSPYVGGVYDLNQNVSLYASYTDIFNPQSEVDIDHQTLSAAHGKAYEAGVKSEWFDHRLYVTGAVFKSEQGGLAEYAGDFPNGQSYYAGVDTEVTGYELEASGALTDRWTLSAGWTRLKVEGENGQPTRAYLPRKTFKAATTYTFPSARNLKVGAAVRWQSEVSMVDIAPVEQDAYAVVDLMAGIDLTEKVRATLNVDNAADKKYLTSLMWNQSYHAAPRSASLRLDFAF